MKTFELHQSIVDEGILWSLELFLEEHQDSPIRVSLYRITVTVPLITEIARLLTTKAVTLTDLALGPFFGDDGATLCEVFLDHLFQPFAAFSGTLRYLYFDMFRVDTFKTNVTLPVLEDVRFVQCVMNHLVIHRFSHAPSLRVLVINRPRTSGIRCPRMIVDQCYLLRNLRYLRLVDIPYGDAPLNTLKMLVTKVLDKLDVVDCALDPNRLIELIRLIASSDTLVEVSLQRMGYLDFVQHREIKQAVERNHTLQEFFVNSTEMVGASFRRKKRIVRCILSRLLSSDNLIAYVQQYLS